MGYFLSETYTGYTAFALQFDIFIHAHEDTEYTHHSFLANSLTDYGIITTFLLFTNWI